MNGKQSTNNLMAFKISDIINIILISQTAKMTFSTSTFILQLTQTMHTIRVGQYDGMFHYSISELISLIIYLTEFPSRPALLCL